MSSLTIPIILSIDKKIKKYLSTHIEDINGKINMTRYTVIRLYFQQLLKTLLNYNLTDEQISYLTPFKRVIHSKIINEIVYEFPERICKILESLNYICEIDPFICSKIEEWDLMTVYF